MTNFFTAEELVANYEKFRKLINNTFEGERLESLNKMYDHFEERIIYTPASSVEHYHNAFPGGYIAHVLRNISEICDGPFNEMIDISFEVNQAFVQFNKLLIELLFDR